MNDIPDGDTELGVMNSAAKNAEPAHHTGSIQYTDHLNLSQSPPIGNQHRTSAGKESW